MVLRVGAPRVDGVGRVRIFRGGLRPSGRVSGRRILAGIRLGRRKFAGALSGLPLLQFPVLRFRFLRDGWRLSATGVHVAGVTGIGLSLRNAAGGRGGRAFRRRGGRRLAA